MIRDVRNQELKDGDLVLKITSCGSGNRLVYCIMLAGKPYWKKYSFQLVTQIQTNLSHIAKLNALTDEEKNIRLDLLRSIANTKEKGLIKQDAIDAAICVLKRDLV